MTTIPWGQSGRIWGLFYAYLSYAAVRDRFIVRFDIFCFGVGDYSHGFSSQSSMPFVLAISGFDGTALNERLK
ncbi:MULTISPECIES: hypothetical protein [unclassified Serratia (in: enterobacteria)]|uniref:hypothetical protein n=1 Tax=unclassified Serratia (in: enterobacteria) TaxID=2647522 RepID=UPI002ED11162|nr:hypothetical protein [Serratia sp. C2(2)]MEE4447176.1 hypothetical protein [Serratia sp. C2(1)]